VKWLAFGTAVLLCVATVSAHHSFSALFDGSTPIQFKGVITSLQIANPHIFIFMNVKGSDGKTESWALEGPSLYGFERKRLKPDFLKKGDTIGVCGYAVRPGAKSTLEAPATGKSGKMFSAELLILPNGQKLAWADYGTRKCLGNR
jgi:hypothetical protein